MCLTSFLCFTKGFVERHFLIHIPAPLCAAPVPVRRIAGILALAVPVAKSVVCYAVVENDLVVARNPIDRAVLRVWEVVLVGVFLNRSLELHCFLHSAWFVRV